MHNEVRNYAQMLQSSILRNYAKVKTTKTTQMKKSPVKESFAQSNSHRNSFTNDSFVSDPRSSWAWQGSWERFVLPFVLTHRVKYICLEIDVSFRHFIHEKISLFHLCYSSC